jgi:hypothetical protein
VALDRYVTPAEFRWFYEIGMALGFRHVESGPLVRSSYHAWERCRRQACEGSVERMSGERSGKNDFARRSPLDARRLSSLIADRSPSSFPIMANKRKADAKAPAPVGQNGATPSPTTTRR